MTPQQQIQSFIEEMKRWDQSAAEMWPDKYILFSIENLPRAGKVLKLLMDYLIDEVGDDPILTRDKRLFKEIAAILSDDTGQSGESPRSEGE